MTDICCIGHITLDEIVTPAAVRHLPGGTAWYFSNALSRLPVSYQLVTAVAGSEKHFISELEHLGISVHCFPTKHTFYFINRYTENQDHRTQQVTQQAAPFTQEQTAHLKASIVHLGPLLANDVPPELIPFFADSAKVSLDAQGYLRMVQDKEVVPVRWRNADRTLPYIHYLKANEYELEVLTGQTDIYVGAKTLATAGVKEVIITLGSRGSMVLHDKTFYEIPAYKPRAVVDATGCGDTYMAGYLCKRVKGYGIVEAGRFGAAMATLNIEKSGAFTGVEEDIVTVMAAAI